MEKIEDKIHLMLMNLVLRGQTNESRIETVRRETLRIVYSATTARFVRFSIKLCKSVFSSDVTCHKSRVVSIKQSSDGNQTFVKDCCPEFEFNQLFPKLLPMSRDLVMLIAFTNKILFVCLTRDLFT